MQRTYGVAEQKLMFFCSRKEGGWGTEPPLVHLGREGPGLHGDKFGNDAGCSRFNAKQQAHRSMKSISWCIMRF